jgi:hypothetical protein
MTNEPATAGIVAIFYAFKKKYEYKIWLQWFGVTLC